MVTKSQASQLAQGEGRRIRRARNIVKRWQAGGWKTGPAHYATESGTLMFSEVQAKRYERAVAILVRAALVGE